MQSCVLEIRSIKKIKAKMTLIPVLVEHNRNRSRPTTQTEGGLPVERDANNWMSTTAVSPYSY